MTRRITLNTFRRVAKLEETMIRASMPRTAAADPVPLPVFATPGVYETVSVRAGLRLVRPLTATIAEAARA